MLSRNRRAILAATAAGALVLVLPTTAVADHETRPHTNNMHARATAHTPRRSSANRTEFGTSTLTSPSGAGWHSTATTTGSGSSISPTRTRRRRSSTSVVTATRATSSSGTTSWFVPGTRRRPWHACDGQTVPAGWEGVHVFDISDLTNPELVASVELPCGSHTLTGARDGGRLIVYSNNSSSAGCTGGDPAGDFIDVIEVPLGGPASSNLLRREPLDGSPVTAVATGCHDAGLILGEVNMLACASADATNVFSVGAPGGGSLADPLFRYAIVEPSVGQAGTNGRWHSASFTWDGEVIVLGWEPGVAPPRSARRPTRQWTRACSSTTRPPAPSWANGPCPAARMASAKTARSTTTTSCRCATAGTSPSEGTTRPARGRLISPTRRTR